MTLRSPLSNVSPTNNKHKEKQDQLLQRKVRDEQDMGEVIIARSPKLLRSNSSKKIAATSSLERAFLMMSKSKAWEAGSNKNNKEEDEAATRVQKVFKGHRTRRSLADCAIVVEELGGSSTTRRLWTIDPRHRYGHNLHLYYDIWFQSSSTQPFFYWLDIGAGREIHHPKCPRNKLNSQLIMYMGMNERAAYQVVVQDGRLVYMQSGLLVNTTDESKWIFVLSTTRSLYVGQKKKGQFQHSSFLAGAATSAAGRLVAKDGLLKAIWPYSGHYLPTEENFNEFITFLHDNKVDLTEVKEEEEEEETI
ncbi:hypothetical protein PR202_gb02306 [Eleusine coracana subsp. coracana]|uniref:Uncharacterized protein n=1 Tax=Eleusine coracana subsp. coracana TaxID=191504 RepID=A0AAV5DYD3_ELECO|nr:hypothetical protein PR202_gb02306 [Eleusine coracana subsp. coracana]